MAGPQLKITVVAEDSTDYLVTVQNANGEHRTPQWVSKSTFPKVLATEWQIRHAQAAELTNRYQYQQDGMEAFGMSFINVYHTDTVWSIFDEPAELPLWSALTARYPGGKVIRLATTIDQVGLEAYEAQLRIVGAHVRPSAQPTSAALRKAGLANTPGDLPSPPPSVSEEPTCTDLHIPNEGPVTVFKCIMAQHGIHDLFSCTGCSADVAATLTPKQQDVYDFGAIFPLCDQCGDEHVAASQRICECLAPETKCTTCTRWSLDRLAATKFQARMRTFEKKRCIGCRVLVRGDETVGKCSFCGGLEVGE